MKENLRKVSRVLKKTLPPSGVSKIRQKHFCDKKAALFYQTPLKRLRNDFNDFDDALLSFVLSTFDLL